MSENGEQYIEELANTFENPIHARIVKAYLKGEDRAEKIREEIDTILLEVTGGH